MSDSSDTPKLEQCVRQALERYFEELNGEKPSGVYDMVLKCMERPVLQCVMKEAGGSQKVASEILGINRNTLRKKLVAHGLAK